MRKPKLADLGIPASEADARRLIAETPILMALCGLAMLFRRGAAREVRDEPKVKSRRPGRRYKARQERIAASGTVRP